MRILSLIPDGFGGRGGIAQFNRDSLAALCADPAVSSVTALPRIVVDSIGHLPERLRFIQSAANNKAKYVMKALIETANPYHIVHCGHLNLLPLAVLLARRRRAKLILTLYGIEAWRPRGPVVRRLLARVDTLIAISEFTKQRFMEWSGVPAQRIHVLPCCVDQAKFGPGDKPDYLLRRYDLAGKTVIMTLARLAGRDRCKGFDEVLEVLPELRQAIPGVVYVIAGEGPDRARLERKVDLLGLRPSVVFAGYVSEVEKADHYRVADLFVMPGRGEGFGIVYLEAMACGTPVVASRSDASQETVLGGAAGELVDPGNLDDVRDGIIRALSRSDWDYSAALSAFSKDAFVRRWNHILASHVG